MMEFLLPLPARKAAPRKGLSFFLRGLFFLALFLQMAGAARAQTQVPAPLAWPGGKQTALSLSFDDARPSQVDAGTAVLNQYGVKATFYLVPATAEKRLEGWKEAIAACHEIGNQSLAHPCLPVRF